MLAFNGKYRPRGWGGANEILDEDWDDLFVPALVTATPWEQWEGTGRNNFGTMIIERPWRRQSPPEPLPAHPPLHPWVRPSRPVPSPLDIYQQVLSAAIEDRLNYYRGVSSNNPLWAALNAGPLNARPLNAEPAPVPTGPPNSVTPSAWQEEAERFQEWREWLGEKPTKVDRRQAIAAALDRLKRGEVEPLRPFCYGCGWRQGGPDSWNGQTCKCGIRGEPLRSASGNYFYGKVTRNDHKGV
jgi:hypothetical protein